MLTILSTRPGLRRVAGLATAPALLLALAAALTACGGRQQATGVVNIPMFDNFYARDVTRVPLGGTVRFPNEGRVPHNAVAVDGSWRTRASVGRDEAATVTVDRPGVYRFYCTFHATRDGKGMAATLVVGDADYYPSQATTGSALRPVKQASGVTRRVPEDHRTIQAAVDAARPGDLVLVGPGVYREEVKVTIPSLVIRGRDRNQVVVDGEFRRPNAISITADGVAVENLTVRNALVNGLFWTGVRGYRASFVTAYNNKDYGSTFVGYSLGFGGSGASSVSSASTLNAGTSKPGLQRPGGVTANRDAAWAGSGCTRSVSARGSGGRWPGTAARRPPAAA
jgi:plastocyanin